MPEPQYMVVDIPTWNGTFAIRTDGETRLEWFNGQVIHTYDCGCVPCVADELEFLTRNVEAE